MKDHTFFQKIKDNNLMVVTFIALLIVLSMWVGTFFFFEGNTNEERGTFGDMFGTVNSLFTGLAFAGIVITILLQKKELSLQRQELEETRKVFITQNDTLNQQRFENTFFNLLSIHHQITDSIDLDIPKLNGRLQSMLDPEIITLRGRDVFKHTYLEFKQACNARDSKFDENKFIEHYERVQTDFGHYFRNLYRMVKMVDEAPLVAFSNPQESLKRLYKTRYKYTSIIRSNLSDYELLWLFYNVLSTNGKDRFQPLVAKYTLLKNIPRNKLIHKLHPQLINYQAFAKNIEKLEIL